MIVSDRQRKKWSSLRSGVCTDKFSANSTTNFFPRTCCARHKKHDRRESGLYKKNFQWLPAVSFYGQYLFCSRLVFPLMVFSCRVYCKGQHLLHMFLPILFLHCYSQAANLYVYLFLPLNYCSAGVTGVDPIFLNYRSMSYLNTLPKYTLSWNNTELYPILIHYWNIFSHSIKSQRYLPAL